jgi:hypothetical protein
LKQYHPFASYTERRVFEGREELDKFYDDGHGRKMASPMVKSRKAVMRFENVIGRIEPKKTESAILNYDIIPCIEKIESSTENYSIPVSVRKIEFTRQVIDAKRGCYR